ATIGNDTPTLMVCLTHSSTLCWRIATAVCGSGLVPQECVSLLERSTTGVPWSIVVTPRETDFPPTTFVLSHRRQTVIFGSAPQAASRNFSRPDKSTHIQPLMA